MPNKKRVRAFSKKAVICFVTLSTILWSMGLPLLPVQIAQAAAPKINLVQYINPTTFQVRFDQLMDVNTIVAGSFTLSTAASGDDTTTNISVTKNDVTIGGTLVTVATVVVQGAKISPSPSDSVKVATSGDYVPKNTPDGVANSDGNMIGIMMDQGAVVVSEVKLSGITATDEFVEIYNRSGGAVDITGWKLTVLAQDGTATDLVTLTGVIANGGFRLIGPTGTTNADATYTAPGANGIDVNNTIILYRPIAGGFFQASDLVGCGTATIKEGAVSSTCPVANATSIERKAAPTSTTATMTSTEQTWGNGNDSNNNSYDFVSQAGAGVNPQSSSSTAEVSGGGGEGGYTNQSPTIDHMPLSQVPSDANATIYANMTDAETPAQALTAILGYSTNNGSNWSIISGQYIAGSPQPFKFIVPKGDGWGTTAFIYYLKVTDGNSASTYRSSSGSENCTTNCTTAETNAKTGAWSVASISSTGWNYSIKGRIVVAGTTPYTGIDNAAVTLLGAGLTFNTTTATDTGTSPATTGAFTFTSLPAGMFRIEASAPGYMMGWLDGVPSKASSASPAAAYADWILGLTAGSGGGQGGDTTSPRVMFSAPGEGMMGAPIKIDIPATGNIEAPILIGFSKDMDSATITTTNIKLKKVSANGTLTDITVSVAYQPQNGNVTLANTRQVGSADFGLDRKAIIYTDADLALNSQYVVDISPAVKDSAQNALQGNKPGGGHTIIFNTGGDFSTFTGSQMATAFSNFTTGAAGGGQYSPPYVQGSTPSSGAKNVPTNAKITVSFSQPMDSAGINSSNTTGTYVKLYDTNYNNSGSGQDVTISVALDSNTKQFATITPTSSLTASHHYAIRVLGGAKSTGGMTMAMPDVSTPMYQADFDTGTAADTAVPTVVGTTLKTYTPAPSCGVNMNVCVTGVPINAGVISVSFSKDMDFSTINTSNITLKSGTTNVTITTTYDPMSRSVKISPSSVLYTVTAYTLTIGTGIKAMNGQALAQDTNQTTGSAYTVSFTTSSTVDTCVDPDISCRPTVQYANADDYRLSITFSEPMNSAKATDTNNWSASVLNPANYVLYTDNGPPPSGQTALYFSNTSLLTATTVETGGPLTLKYDANYSTVTIEGLKLMSGAVKGGFRVWVKNVKDISGNLITNSAKPATAEDFGANSAGGGVMNSSNTFGMIGPGGGGMSGPPTTAALSGGAMAVTAFGGKDPGMMGFKPINAMPMNMLAGQESLYMIDIPLSQAIPLNGQIVLTFPIGFDVANAADADSNKQWAHKDLNGPGLGTVTISGSIAKNATARTVTITLTSDQPTLAAQTNDFLHLEIDRIKNTTEANDGNMATGISMGSGYQVDILTKTSAVGGRTLETLKSMPFFIKKGGANTLTGTITFSNVVTLSNLPIYLMSPMTGPLKTLVSGVTPVIYTFSNLPAGNYAIGSEPLQTISGTDYFIDLNPVPQPIEIITGTTTKHITFQAQSNANKPDLKVYITGTFANESIDIFAGGPGGFTVKTVTLNGPFTNTTPSPQTLYLPNTGTFMVGMGLAMPRGPQQSGPPPMPSWMPPKSIEVNVSASGLTSPNNWSWKDEDGAADLDAAANDGEITLGVTTANKTILGHVYAPTGTTGIQNAEVFAYSPMGGMGSHAQTAADGSFSLKVTEGSYKVGTFIPGMPASTETMVEVKTVGLTTTIYANGAATNDVILRVNNPGTMYTISGTVTDGTNVIKDASVYGRRTDGPGNLGAKTDSTGKYILYAQSGIWQVGVFLPQYGNLAEQTVTISSASQANIDFSPAVGTNFYTVKGRVCKDTSGNDICSEAETDASNLSNVHIDFDKTGGYHNSAIVQAGTYSISVPSGTYTVTGWSSSAGKLPVKTVVVGTSNIDLGGAADVPIPNTKTVTVYFKDATTGNPVTLDNVYVQLDKIGTKDVGNGTYRDNVSSLTLDVPTGTDYQYALDIDIPGVADDDLAVASPTPGLVTGQDIIIGDANDPEMYQVKIESDVTLNVTVPTLYTITGTAKDNSNNLLPKTIINIKKPGGSDISLAVETNSLGEYSVKLPASGAIPYLFQIDKAGYVDTATSIAVTGAAVQAFNTVKTTMSISGQIKIGSAGVEGAGVYAKELGGGFASTQTDPSGNYTLSVTSGDWKVSAASDGYQEKPYANASGQNIVVSTAASNQPGINITLDTQKTGLAGLNNEDITPSSGGTFKDGTASLEVSASPNAIAASQSIYQMEDYEVANITSTATAKTIGGEAVEIKAYEPSGSSMVPKSTFDDEVTIEKAYTKAELVTAGIDSFSKADAVKMSYFDEASSNWQPVPTTIAYLDTNSAPIIPLTDLSNVYYVVYAGVSDHLTVYSPTNPIPDGLAPSAPTGLTQSTGTGSAITLTWTAPTTNQDGSAYLDPLGYEIYRSTNGTTYTQINGSDVLTAGYTDSAVASFTSYYYKVTAADTGGIESVMSSALQVCSNKTISNGTVTASCAISCDTTTGYVQSGNACVAAGSAYIPSSSSPSAPTAPAAQVTASTTTTISAAAGGTTPAATTVEGATAKASMPVEAVTANTTVSITPTATTATAAAPAVAAVPTGMKIAGGFVYNYSATSAGQAVTTFAKPVTLTFTYTDSQVSGLDESTLTINYWDAANSKWVTMETNVDLAKNTLTAATTHFTYFAILGNKIAAKPTVTTAQLKTQLEAQIIAIMKQIIVLITRLIAELQAKLVALQGQ